MEENIIESQDIVFSGSDEEFSDEEYISSEDLIEKLKNIISNVESGIYNEVKRQDIFDSIEEYLPGRSTKPLDPRTISYLFTGWWVNQISKFSKDEDINLSEIFDLDKCPLCFKSLKDNLNRNEE